MNKNIKNIFLLTVLMLFFGITIQAQSNLKAGDLVDGIAVVVGDEIILESDIAEQANYAKLQGGAVPNRCPAASSTLPHCGISGEPTGGTSPAGSASPTSHSTTIASRV